MPETLVPLPEDQNYAEALNLDGKQEVYDRKKVRELAQKGAAVLPKLQSEYDRLKVQHEQEVQATQGMKTLMNDLTVVLKSGDPAALTKMAQGLGVSVSELKGAMAKAAGVTAAQVSDEDGDVETLDDDEDELPSGKPVRRQDKRVKMSAPAVRQPLGLDDLPAELRELIADGQKAKLGRLRETLFSQLDTTLDADEKIGKILRDKARASEATVVRQLGREALQRFVVVEGRDTGPQVYRDVIADVRGKLEQMGIPWERIEDDGDVFADVGDHTVQAELETALTRKQPPVRVPIQSMDYRESFRQKFANNLRKLLKSKGA